MICRLQWYGRRSLHLTTRKYKDDGPIKYSTSKASSYRAFEIYFKANPNKPSQFEQYCSALIYAFSTSSFLLYFGVLREENDIDEMLSETALFKVDEKLEASQLRERIIYEEKNGDENLTALKERLAVIEDRQTK